MQSRVISTPVAIIFVAILIVLNTLLAVLATGDRSNTLEVTFLDVGQGDSVLIETPTGSQVLIDGGASRAADRPLSDVLPFYDRTLDMIVATHPDSDHIGGLISVLDDYRVEQVVMPTLPSDTKMYSAFRLAVQEEQSDGSRLRKLTRGDVVDLGGGAYLITLFPFPDHTPPDTNASSLILKLVYGDTSWLFSGDSPQTIENYLTSIDGKFLDADVLKVGHHGSDTSSSKQFLAAVSPALAVVSAGQDNQYGHPEPSVLKRLQAVSAETICTCELGTITLTTNGAEITRQ